MKTTLFRELSSLVTAIHNCEKNGNTEWEAEHTGKLGDLCRDYLPHGSGFDCGAIVDVGASNTEHLVIRTSYHRMDEYGGYDGWLELKIVVIPSLLFGFHLKITGVTERRDPGMREYFGDVFHEALRQEIEVGVVAEVPECKPSDTYPVIGWVRNAETGVDVGVGPLLLSNDMARKLTCLLQDPFQIEYRDLDPTVRKSEEDTDVLRDLVKPF